jgi:hypothetical protein
MLGTPEDYSARLWAALGLFLKAPTPELARRVLGDFPELRAHGTRAIDALIRDNPTLLWEGSARSEAIAKLRERRELLEGYKAGHGDFAASKKQYRTSQQQKSGCSGPLILIFLASLAVATVVGIILYNHLARPAIKIPESQIPQITQTSTYQKGVLVYVRVQYSDPSHYAQGFGFVGANGAQWAEENHSFADPSYGIPGPDRIDYPFNLGCGTSSESSSDVQFWINDTAGGRSQPEIIHLACKN